MFQKLYDWTLRLAGHRHAMRSLALVSFAESSFFPIPPDVMVVPMIIARRDQAYRIALVCSLSSVAGAALGYAIGYFLYDSVGEWLIRVYGMADKAAEFHRFYAEWGAWIILLKGFTPIPFKLVTIVSGIAHYNFPLFILAAAVTRGARFFLIAALLRRYGAQVQAFIEKRLTLVGLATLASIIIGFAVVSLI
jgi:membrane protein YqaA with SNARE-associated domain